MEPARTDLPASWAIWMEKKGGKNKTVVVLVRVPVAGLASNLIDHPKDADAGRQGPQRGAGLASSDTSGDLSGLVVQPLVRTTWLPRTGDASNRQPPLPLNPPGW